MKNNKDMGFWGKSPEEYANLKNESRKTILFPAVSNLIPLQAGDSILDYGGGDGGFLELFINNNVHKYLYDPSEGMIEFARRNRCTIEEFDISDEKLQANFFDAITLIHVVTVIREDAELQRIFLRIHEIMKDDGAFVLGMTHPAFKNNFFSTFHTDFSINKVEYEYLKNCLPYYVHLQGEKENEYLSFECYHRSISMVMNTLIDTGFSISKVLEVEDKDFRNPNKKYNFPPFLIIKSKKTKIK
jgi:SAM-dependent methyltransferase